MSRITTLLAHSGDGQAEKISRTYSSVPEVQPVYMSSVFAFDDTQSVDDIYEGINDGYVYARMKHPNNDAVSEILAKLDGAEAGLVFSSGMAAIITSIISVVSAGDHIVSSPVLYGGVRSYLENELKRFGVSVTFTDFSDVKNVEAAITPETKLVYTETISNPLMAVPDLPAIANVAHRHGALFFVDNTFSPVVADPISYGADVTLYSATKYLGGHSDLVAGAAVGRADIISGISKQLVLYGSVLGAAESWLLARSLRTLELRVTKQSQNALKIAQYLEKHPAINRVYYPGLESSPSHDTAKKLFTSGLYGGMLSADIRGGADAASKVIDNLGFIKYVPSLAGTSTSVSYPARTSPRSYSRSELEKEGITEGLLRFSAGIEDADDIISQLDRTLGVII
ncbi:MAG: aminotransferase class I/II-fold pyridoxal phosphate-dependent enzyme [Oscillospiraceae bacterium]|nr:aminotransferase class I/II-fold pyridoxal phosphate-dependent enzyme [Oscillospiraceae bacterium]